MDVSTDIPRMTSNFVVIVLLSHRQGNCIPLQPSDGMILIIGPRLAGHPVIFPAIQTHISYRFLLAANPLGQLERDVAAMRKPSSQPSRNFRLWLLADV